MHLWGPFSFKLPHPASYWPLIAVLTEAYRTVKGWGHRSHVCVRVNLLFTQQKAVPGSWDLASVLCLSGSPGWFVDWLLWCRAQNTSACSQYAPSHWPLVFNGLFFSLLIYTCEKLSIQHHGPSGGPRTLPQLWVGVVLSTRDQGRKPGKARVHNVPMISPNCIGVCPLCVSHSGI